MLSARDMHRWTADPGLLACCRSQKAKKRNMKKVKKRLVGEEHWTKVLRVNSGRTDDVRAPHQLRVNGDWPHGCGCDQSQPLKEVSRFHHDVSKGNCDVSGDHSRGRCGQKHLTCDGHRPVRGHSPLSRSPRRQLPIHDDGSHRKTAVSNGDSHFKSDTSPHHGHRTSREGMGLLAGLTSRLRRWVRHRRKYEVAPPSPDTLTSGRGQSAGLGHAWPDDLHDNYVLLHAFRQSPIPTATPPQRTTPTVIVSHVSQSRVPAHLPEVRPLNDPDPDPALISHHALLDRQRRISRRQDRASLHSQRQLDRKCSRRRHAVLTGTISCPPQSQGQQPRPDFRRLLQTWPLPGRKTQSSDDADGGLVPEITFLKEDEFDRRGAVGKEALEDCRINFTDLDVGECLGIGRRRAIHRGRWHGEVTVHLFREPRDPETEEFWTHLAKLCRIRHENIALFMGACIDPPNLAVVTSAPTGPSLHEHLHVKRERISMTTRVHVLWQVAVGLGYLHAKGIALRKLNTHNIFLCPRVKVSAMDYSFARAKLDRPNFATVPRGHLTYVAPEILATMRVAPPRLVTSLPYSYETDVFAFGTVMYEVFSGEYPYRDLPPEVLIWQVCSGRRQGLESLTCTSPFKSLIDDCWAHESFYRPSFPEICKELHKNSPMYKRHSSSEPERLHRQPGQLDFY